MDWLQKLLSRTGVVFYGVVTAIPGGNQFTIPALAGLGSGRFQGATSPYSAFVVRDAGGAAAAPQGEIQAITAYNTSTGVFTTAAFTAAVAVGDEILIIHPSLAYMLGLTPARAGYLDNLIGVVATGTFSLVNNTNEQDCIVFNATTQLIDIELDMVNLTQSNTVREYVKVDGTNYRQISAKVFPTDFDTNTKCVTIAFPQKNSMYKITLQAAVLEGGARNVPYRYMTRDLA